MPVYMIADIEVTNQELYSKYIEKAPQVIEKFGGRYLVRGGKVTPISGNWNPQRVIVIEFQTMHHLQNCFTSPEYLDLQPLREHSTISKAIIVEGA